MSEQVQALNQIIGIIDEKASRYKDERFDMSTAQAYAQKKLILDLIDDAFKLCSQIKPAPVEATADLQKLQHQFQDMS